MTLSCAQLSDLLEGYLLEEYLLDKSIDSTILPESLQAHLADCHTCQHNWQEQQAFHQAVVSAVQSLPEPRPLPENFTAQLEARLHQEARPIQNSKSLWQLFSSPAARSTIAAGVLLLVFASTAWQTNIQNQPSHSPPGGVSVQQPQIATGLQGVGSQSQPPTGSGTAGSAGTGSALSETSVWDELEAEVPMDDDPLAQIVGF
ncbi:MAG: hypothetical protein K2X01_07045 [Cyanobacteria bacterium]|nr:hypothetical protein [Cyanobacteriota bacterium]